MMWPTKALGQLVRGGDLPYGIVQPGPDTSGGVPIVRVKDVRSGRVDVRDPLRVADEVSSRHQRTVLEGGELLLSIVGTVGESAVAPASLAGWNVARAIAVIRPIDVTADWVRLCLQTPELRERLTSMLNTTVQATLNLADLRRLPIPMPPEPVRLGIVEVLGALDDKIAANGRLGKAINELLAAKFARLAEGLDIGQLAAIADVNVESTKPQTSGSIHYVDIASVGAGSYELSEPIAWRYAPGRARRVLRRGDTVWSTVRPNRRSHALVLDEFDNLVASTGLAVVTPKGGRFAYVYEATRTGVFTAYLEGVAEGSAYPAVRGERFASAPIPAANERQMDQFEELAAPLRTRLHAATLESRTLAKIRDALLPQLMSGKIRVKDAQRVVEGDV